MISVEVYDLDDTADEAAAVRTLQETRGLDNHHASQPFSLLYWHKRPFSVQFSSAEEASRFVERLRTCGYRARAFRRPGLRLSSVRRVEKRSRNSGGRTPELKPPETVF